MIISHDWIGSLLFMVASLAYHLLQLADIVDANVCVVAVTA